MSCYVWLYSCGHISSQCRCPAAASKERKTLVAPCPACAAKRKKDGQ